MNCKEYTVKVYDTGDIFWYKPGGTILHREDGPAIEFINGDKIWYIDGQYHRENNPAIIYKCGEKNWYKNGLRHRLDGPAIECPDGTKKWFIEGQSLSEMLFNKLVNKDSCNGKIVEIDGVKYTLTEVK